MGISGLQTSGDQENDGATSNRSMPDQHDKGYAHWFAIFFVAMLESLPLGLVVVKSLWKSYAGGVRASVTPGLPGKQPAQTAAQVEPPKYQLSTADSRIVPGKWLPPRTGIIPHVRIVDWWINVLWALPIGFVFLVIAITVAHGLRTIPAVQQFIAAYPGQVSVPVYSGYPTWLRWQHFFNFFLLFFIMRSGIQILADHPRLYWN